MILVDANLLIYAYHRAAPQHDAARAWLEHVLSGVEPVRLAWVTVLAFLRITTSPRAIRQPLPPARAASIVEDWFGQPHVDVLHPSERHWTILQELLQAGQAVGPLVMDAHLAALAIEHGATLYTTDRDFTRFPRLRVRNPIDASEPE